MLHSGYDRSEEAQPSEINQKITVKERIKHENRSQASELWHQSLMNKPMNDNKDIF